MTYALEQIAAPGSGPLITRDAAEMGVKPTTVALAMYRFFEGVGIKTIFGNPGSTELPMFREFPEDWDYVLGLQESSVVGMADGFARATGNAAIVNLHSAAGLGHALGAVFGAMRNQAPLVIIAGQQARSILPYEPFLYAQRATEFPQPYVKWAIEPARAEDVPAAIARAYHIAMQSPRGPTFVSVPSDDWDRPATEIPHRKVSRITLPDAGLIDELGIALSRSKRPAFVVGAQLSNDDAWDEVVALAERLQAHVFGSPLSARNAFPEDHALFAGFLDPFREDIVRALQAYDLIFAIGAPLFTYHVEGEGPFIPDGAAAFQLVNDPSMATWSPIGTAIVGNIKAGLSQLLDDTKQRPGTMGAASRGVPKVDGDQLSEAYLIDRVAAACPRDAIVVEEAPGSRNAIQARMRMTGPDSYHTMASGALGWGVPAAVGLAMGSPGRRVVALIGDGSAMYSPQALWTAAQRRLPILFVIVRNGGYSVLERLGKHYYSIQKTIGSRLPMLDYVAMANGFGMEALRIEDPAALDAALARGLASDAPLLLEVVTDQ